MLKTDRIFLASSNEGKIKEISDCLAPFNIQVLGIGKKLDESIEDGKSFFENAFKKAFAGAKIVQDLCLADDSGLCVPFLNNEPGVHSARYFENGKGMEKILSALTNERNLCERTAFFICSLVLSDPFGKVIWRTEKTWQGSIAFEAKGKNGFGYDPIFIPEKFFVHCRRTDARRKKPYQS